ncbi:MAG: 1,4-dihydroxy-2-naphthoate polyprenyltransferase, partial [Chloroflexota bacterium]|nr:1,4-dihydroxy-2-naphthoate polyprenyltransferase [Chloroflexota bacterium]
MDTQENSLKDTQADRKVKNPAVSWKVWVKTARPFSLTAAVSPVLVGTAVAAYDGTFHLVTFLAALFSSLFLQIGANYFNEYFDHRYGLDTVASLGSSTVIFRREMTAAQVLIG